MAKKRVHRPEGFRPAQPAERQSQGGAPARRQRRGARSWFEGFSRPLIQVMARLPTFLLPTLLALLLFAGLAVPAPWAGGLLLVIAVFLTWLTALSWPAISTGSRMLRVVVDLGMVALAVLKLLGRI